MPSFGEIRQFFTSQVLQTPVLPQADLRGKTIVVTGANTGLGLDCCKHLYVCLSQSSSHLTVPRAKFNASTLILACRNVQKGETAKRAILDHAGPSSKTTIEVWQVDLDSFDSVKSFAARINTQLTRLDGLIANAGVSLEEFSLCEGYERTVTVNVISTFLLALLVLPKLNETATSHHSSTNLVLLGSAIHVFAPAKQLQVSKGQTIFDTLSDPKTAAMKQRYMLSKLMVHLVSRELASRITTQGGKTRDRVTVNWVNPGWCKTELFRNETPNVMARIMLSLIGRTSEEGSRTLVHGVVAGADTHDCYLSECQIKPESDFVKSAESRIVQERLWEELATILEKVSPGVMSGLR